MSLGHILTIYFRKVIMKNWKNCQNSELLFRFFIKNFIKWIINIYLKAHISKFLCNFRLCNQLLRLRVMCYGNAHLLEMFGQWLEEEYRSALMLHQNSFLLFCCMADKLEQLGTRDEGSSCLGFLKYTQQVLFWKNPIKAKGHFRWSYWLLDRIHNNSLQHKGLLNFLVLVCHCMQID